MTTITNPTSAALSSIRIPLRWWHLIYQRANKKHKWTSISPRSCLKLLMHQMLPISLLSNAYLVHGAPPSHRPPGKNHVFVSETYNDLHRQHDLVQHIITNTVRQNPSATYVSNRTGSPSIRIELCIDIGSNRWIVNDRTLLSHFLSTQGRVKEIGGTPTIIVGTYNLPVILKSYGITSDKFISKEWVYVPKYPYNLLPLRLLLKVIKGKEYFPEDPKLAATTS